MSIARNYKEGIHPPCLDFAGSLAQGEITIFRAPDASGNPQVVAPSGSAPWLQAFYGVNQSAGFVGGSGTSAGEELEVVRQGLSRVLLENGQTTTRGCQLIASGNALGYVAPRTPCSFSALVVGQAEEAVTASGTDQQIEAYVQPYWVEIVRPVTGGCVGAIGQATKYLAAAGQAVAAAQVALYQARFSGEVVRNLSASLATAPGGTDTVAMTVQKSSDNGATWSDLAVTATITGTGKSATDLVHTATLAAGDLLAIKAVSSNVTAAGATVTFDVT
jgi:hypothetical protein